MKQNKELNDLVFLALDHGIDSVRDGGNLVPFTLAKTKGKPELIRVMVENLQDSETATKEIVFERKPKMYAIAYDGYITIDEKKYDAIIVEAGEKGKHKALKFCQRYIPKKLLRKFGTVGNAMYLGKVKNVLM
ncbi:hypothetical protein HYV81_06165 [Candidatus Woesearchaeota archaeon]|nr:hypothetical protein [Candidatus Woesearchaeota archaeon]